MEAAGEPEQRAPQAGTRQSPSRSEGTSREDEGRELWARGADSAGTAGPPGMALAPRTTILVFPTQE